MASLFNTKISNTYVGLLKMSDNLILSSSLREISDGSGNGAGVYLNTSGDLKASGILEFGSLKDTGESITISKFVDEADGIANNDNDTSIPTSAAIVDYVAARITLEDLDFSGDSGTGSVDLDSQVFAIVGTANEIETSAGSQQLQIGLPSNVTISSNLQVNGLLKGNNNIVIKDTSDRTMAAFYGGDKSELYFNDSKKLETTSDGATISGGLTATGSSTFTSASFSGTITGNVTGNVTGDITGVGTLSDGSTAVTQSINDNSTKIATTAYVDASVDTVDTLSEILAVGNTTGGTNIAVSASDDITFTDTSKAKFGDGNDLEIFHNGSQTYLQNYVGEFNFIQHANDQDIIFKSDDGSGGTAQYFKLDGSIVKTVFSKNQIIEDSIYTEYGSDGDLKIHFNGTDSYIQNYTGDLQIQQTADDKDILFRADDGSGGVTTYFYLDGSGTRTIFQQNTRHDDNVYAGFGTDSELRILHDGTNSYIKDVGTGNLFIQASNSLNLRSADNEWYLDGIANGAVNIYFDNVKKFETTATGIAITGGIDMNDGDITEVNSISWNDGITLSELGADNYLRLKYNDTGNGGIQIVDGDNTIQGYVYSDGGETASIGFLTGSGDWGVKAIEDGSVSLMHDNTAKLSTTATGISVSGEISASGNITISNASPTFTLTDTDNSNNITFNSVGGALVLNSTSDQVFQIGGTEKFRVGSTTASFAGGVTIAGDLTVNGTTTTVNTQTLAVEDPLISLAKDNSANSLDIGFYGRYNDGSDKYLGFFADASDSNRFKLFKGTGTEPTTTVDTAASGYEYADVLLASLEARGNLTIKQQDDSGFDGGLIITRSANTQKLVVGMDGGAVNFNSPDSLTYKFRANGTEIASIDNTGSLSVSGNINIGDDKKLNFGAVPDYEIYHNSTTNVNHISSLIDRQLSINANTILLTNQANDSTYLNLASSLATFSQDVTIGSTGAASDKTLSILTGGSNSSIKLMEAGTIYGFSQVYDGVNNQFFIKRHSNSASGSAVVTMNRDNDAITLAGNLSSTASTVHFSLANMSAYQLNGTYVMDSSRNLVNIGNFTGAGSIKSTLAIDNSTLPDVPSEHVILLNPPTTTDYYGGGISWSEGTNTAASLGVYDNGSGGALGFYIATGSNSGLSHAFSIDKNQNVGIGTVLSAIDGQLHVKGTTNKTLKLDPTFDSGTFTTLAFARNGTDKWRVFHPSDDSYLSFFNENISAHQLTLASSGKIGIGQVSPTTAKLVVAGEQNTYTARLDGDTTTGQSYGLRIRAGTNSSDKSVLVENTSASELFSIKGDGVANFSGNVTTGGVFTSNGGAISINGGGSIAGYFYGSGSSYTQGALVISSGTDNSPEARGQGVFMFNEGKDSTWYMGTRYNNADEWQVGRVAGTSLDTAAATTAQAVFKIDNTGSATFNTGLVTINKANSGTEGGSLLLRNSAGGSGAFSRIYFAPTASSYTTRSAIIQGENTDGNNNMALVFKTSAGADPTEKMRIDNNGNVTIQKSGLFVGNDQTSGVTEFKLTNKDTSLVDADDIQNRITMRGLYYDQSSSLLVETNIVSIHESSNGNGNSAMAFYTQSGGSSPTEKVRITSAGDIGIGSASPSSYNSRGQDLVIKKTGSDVGISIVAEASGGTDYSSSVLFGDGTGGTAAYRGVIEYDHADDSMAFSTAGTERLEINSTGNANFTQSKITKGGTQYSTSSTTTYTDILTFDTTTNNRAYSVLLSSSENNYSQMYRVSGSVAQSTCIKFELGDSGHAHSKDVEFRITDVSGVRTLQVKAITHTTLKVINVYDVCVALGNVTFA